MLFLFAFVFSVSSFAQNWNPIDLNTKSVFTQHKYPAPLACFSIDSMIQVGADSTFYYNYQLYGQNLNDSMDYSPCTGFGGDCYMIQNQMSWWSSPLLIGQF